MRTALVLSLIALGAACAPIPHRVGPVPRPPPAPRAPSPRAPPAVAEPVVRPCLPDTNDARTATAKLAALDAEIAAVAPNAAGAAIGKEIEELLEGPCFALVSAPYPFAFDSGLALKVWWQEGGKGWLENQLALGYAKDPSAPRGVSHYFLVPPSARKSLASDLQPKHPLAPLLCPAAAALPDAMSTCGRETLGWVHRATQAFAHLADARRAEFLDMSPPAEPPPSLDKCEADATVAPPEGAYAIYSACIIETSRRTDALPLGRFSMPKRGWLVLRGRRGHYGFCDEIRAYDLATGSAYIARSCGGLVLMPGGSVNGPATTATRQSNVEVGRIPLDALREAALFLLLAGTAERDVVLASTGRAIPDAISIQLPERLYGGTIRSSMGWSSGRTVVEASWVLDGRGQARTTTDWPDSYVAAKEHAAELLAVAELGFVAGCAPARLPSMPWGSLGPVIDEEGYMPTFDDQPAYEQLHHEMDALRARPACK